MSASAFASSSTDSPYTPYASSSKSPLRIVSNPLDADEAEGESPALSSTASSPSTDDDSLTSPTSPSLSDEESFDDHHHITSSLPRNPRLVITPNTPTPESSPKPKASSSSASPMRASAPRRMTRLSPLTTSLPAPPSHGGAKLGMPKSQPLARTLYARMGNTNDVPHAGFAGVPGAKRGNGAQKLIVPKKAFKTTFCLDLTASEFARTA